MARGRRRRAAHRDDAGPRWFTALMLPEELADPLARAAAVALGLPREGLRGVEPWDLHLTLAFAGPLSGTAVRELDRALALSLLEAPAPRIALGPAGAFPAPGRERVLLLHAADRSAKGRDAEDAGGTLLDLRERCLEAGELAGVVFEQERGRPFRPHVTLARVGPGARQRVPARFYGLEIGIEWQPSAVAWVRSPGGGAPYEVVASYPLAGPEDLGREAAAGP